MKKERVLVLVIVGIVVAFLVYQNRKRMEGFESTTTSPTTTSSPRKLKDGLWDSGIQKHLEMGINASETQFQKTNNDVLANIDAGKRLTERKQRAHARYLKYKELYAEFWEARKNLLIKAKERFLGYLDDRETLRNQLNERALIFY